MICKNIPHVKWTKGLFLLFFFNLVAWAPLILSGSYFIGLGHDSHIYGPSINALLWRANLPWDPVLRLYEARVDIFSFPVWSVFYPSHWAFSYGTILSYKQLLTSTTIILFFHQVCASLTFFVLLRGLRCRPLYAAFGGMSYAYSLHLQNWAEWVDIFSGFTWLPLCLFGILLITKKNNYLLGCLLLSVGYGLVLLASSLAALYTLALSLIFFIASVPVSRHDFNTTIKKLGFVGLGGLLGAMVGAPAIIPIFTRSSEYIRWFSGGSVEGGMQVPYEGTLVDPIDRWGVFHLLSPLEYGNSLGDIFIGIAVLFLSGYLIIHCARRRRFALVLFAGAIYFVLDAMGNATPIHHLTYQIPFLNSIRYPIAGGIVVVVCLLTTGILGAEELSQNLSKGRSYRPHGIVLFILSTILMISIFLLRNEMGWIFKQNLGFSLLILSVSGSIIASLLLVIKTTKINNNIVPFILLASFFPMNTLLVQEKISKPDINYLSCIEFRELTEDLAVWRKELGKNTRIATLLDNSKNEVTCLSKLNISDSRFNSVAMASGWDVSIPYLSPRPSKEFKLFNKLGRLESLLKYDSLLKTGITHVLSNLPPSEVPSFYTKIHNSGSFYLYAIKDAAMGMNIAGCIENRNGQVQIVTNIGRREISIKKSALAELTKTYSCANQTTKELGIVDVSRNESGSIVEYNVDSSSNLLLVTDRVFNNNWYAQVNNKPVTPIIVDEYRLAIALEGGESNVELKYRPRDFSLSLVISTCGIFLIVVIGIYLLYTQKKNFFSRKL